MYILLFLRLETSEAKNFYKGSNTKHIGKGWYGQKFVGEFLQEKVCHYKNNESLKGKIDNFYLNVILRCFQQGDRIKPEEIIVKVNEFTNDQIPPEEIKEASTIVAKQEEERAKQKKTEEAFLKVLYAGSDLCNCIGDIKRNQN